MRYLTRLLLSIGIVLFSLAPLAADELQVKRFGKLTITKQGEQYSAQLGKLGTFRFSGTFKPLALETKVTVDQLKTFPGYWILSRLGLEEIRLGLNGDGLYVTGRVDTKKNLKALCSFLKIEAPFVEITAQVGTGSISLRGDLMFSRKAIEVTLSQKLGTVIKLDKLSLCFDFGLELGGKKLVSIEAPVITVAVELHIQPTKWDPSLKTIVDFSYNLGTQEMTLSGSVMDRWANPLGLSRVFKDPNAIVLENAAFQIGWIPGSPTPTKIGFALEKAKIFEIEAGFAIDISPADQQVAFMAKLNKLSFNDLARIIGKGLGKKVPNDLIPGDLALRDVDVLFSPNGGKVGQVEIDQGFRLKGNVSLGKVFQGMIDFTANFDEGLILAIELKSGLRDVVLDLVRKNVLLTKILSKVTQTLDLRRIALDIKATKTEMGGGFAADLTVFGKRINFSVSGSFNPEKLARMIVQRIVDFATGPLKEAFSEVGQGFVQIGAEAKQWATAVGEGAKKAFNTAGIVLKHAGHKKATCLNKCVPEFAEAPRQYLLRGANEAVIKFYEKSALAISQVEGEDAQQTRSLREALLADEWNKLTSYIDMLWTAVHNSEDARKFFNTKAQKDAGVAKFRGLIAECRDEHQRLRAVLYSRLLTMAPSLELAVKAHVRGIGIKEAAAGGFAGTKGQSRPVQDYSITLKNPVPGLGLRYKAHVSNVGDTRSVGGGEFLGYAEKQNIEGISIELTGAEAAAYDVFYTTHIQNLGDSPVAKNGEYCGTRARGLAIEGLTVRVEKKKPLAQTPGLAVKVFMKGTGEKAFGAGEFAGTRGESRPVQDFSVAFTTVNPDLGLRYKAHVSNVGDTAYKAAGQAFGYANAQNIEGFSFELTGADASSYDVFYSAHIAGVGDSAVFKNGEYCGTKGKGQAIEGLSVWVEKKAVIARQLSLEVSVVVYLKGLANREFGSREFAGTKGQGRPVQDFSIVFKNPSANLGLRYKAHVSNVGDTAFLAAGQSFGYAGKQNVEGFAIELTGPDATLYDVFYTAHVSNVGDVAVCRNGEYCGTKGRGLAVEGMTVWIEKKK